MPTPFPARRRFPRFKLPARFHVKARVRFLGQTTTHYFRVDNLSMGGANLVSRMGVPLELKPGDTLELLIFGGHLSLRCVARFVQGTIVDRNCLQAGIEIIGIDEKSRNVLGDFLDQLAQNILPRSEKLRQAEKV